MSVLAEWLKCIGSRLGVYTYPECRLAEEFFVRAYPACRATGAQLVKREFDKCVVAVFYQSPPKITEPTEVSYFFVFHDHRVEEREINPDSPYFIRGMK